MCEVLLGHQVVRLYGRLDVWAMNATRHPHEHVLRAFHNLATDAQEVCTLECLEAKVVKAKVSFIVDCRIKLCSICFHKAPQLLAEKRCISSLLISEAMEHAASLSEGVGRALVQVGHCNPCSKYRVVWVSLRHVSTCFSCQHINLCRLDAMMEAFNHLLSDGNRVHILGIQAIAQCTNPFADLVKLNRLTVPVTLHNLHAGGHCCWGCL
mmetsp:Transcript_35211/g.80625  ORF Transcript_35211/g.80625 Transcript_35211/m.80625 type:complete len:210 (+) Transcript_35211:1264-1893(+)